MKKRSTTISFRADSELTEQIDIARKPFGISRGDWVRGVTVSRVFESDRQELDAHFASIEEMIEALQHTVEAFQGRMADERKFHARILFVLLTEMGSTSSDEAKAIIRRILEK